MASILPPAFAMAFHWPWRALNSCFCRPLSTSPYCCIPVSGPSVPESSVSKSFPLRALFLNFNCLFLIFLPLSTTLWMKSYGWWSFGGIVHNRTRLSSGMFQMLSKTIQMLRALLTELKKTFINSKIRNTKTTKGNPHSNFRTTLSPRALSCRHRQPWSRKILHPPTYQGHENHSQVCWV